MLSSPAFSSALTLAANPSLPAENTQGNGTSLADTAPPERRQPGHGALSALPKLKFESLPDELHQLIALEVFKGSAATAVADDMALYAEISAQTARTSQHLWPATHVAQQLGAADTHEGLRQAISQIARLHCEHQGACWKHAITRLHGLAALHLAGYGDTVKHMTNSLSAAKPASWGTQNEWETHRDQQLRSLALSFAPAMPPDHLPELLEQLLPVSNAGVNNPRFSEALLTLASHLSPTEALNPDLRRAVVQLPASRRLPWQVMMDCGTMHGHIPLPRIRDVLKTTRQIAVTCPRASEQLLKKITTLLPNMSPADAQEARVHLAQAVGELAPTAQARLQTWSG